MMQRRREVTLDEFISGVMRCDQDAVKTNEPCSWRGFFLRSVRPCIPHADSKSVQKQSINQLIEKMRSLVDFGLSLTAHLLAIVDGFLTSMVTWSCLDRLCKKNPQKMPLQIHPKLLQWIADFHLVSLFFFHGVSIDKRTEARLFISLWFLECSILHPCKRDWLDGKFVATHIYEWHQKTR